MLHDVLPMLLSICLICVLSWLLPVVGAVGVVRPYSEQLGILLCVVVVGQLLNFGVLVVHTFRWRFASKYRDDNNNEHKNNNRHNNKNNIDRDTNNSNSIVPYYHSRINFNDFLLLLLDGLGDNNFVLHYFRQNSNNNNHTYSEVMIVLACLHLLFGLLFGFSCLSMLLACVTVVPVTSHNAVYVRNRYTCFLLPSHYLPHYMKMIAYAVIFVTWYGTMLGAGLRWMLLLFVHDYSWLSSYNLGIWSFLLVNVLVVVSSGVILGM